MAATGKNLLQLVGVLPSTQLERGFLVINVMGEQVLRAVGTVGNFSMLMFFISIFFVLDARHLTHYVFFSALLVLSGASILMSYGRTSYLMVLTGLIVGMTLEKEHRRRYLVIFSCIGLVILISLVLFSFVFAHYRHRTVGSILLSLWFRFQGIGSEVAQGGGTFGARLSEVQEFFRVFLKNLPFGIGMSFGKYAQTITDVGFFPLLLNFGILAPVFYVWILRNAIRRFSSVYRQRLSSRAMMFLKGSICYGISQLVFMPIQDPFFGSLGVLLVVFLLAILECVARLDLFSEDSSSSRGTNNVRNKRRF
jgi:hypothetical protein